PVVEALAELRRWSVEKGTLLRSQGDGRNAAKLRPVRLAAEQLGVPADSPRLKRLALGLGYRGHRAFERAIGRQYDIFLAQFVERQREQTCSDEPSGKRPQREHRPMQMAVNETYLCTQGEENDAERPEPERRAVHGESEQDEQGSDYENELSHGLPPKAPWPACVPNPAAPRWHRLVPMQNSSGAIFALYGLDGPSTSSFFLGFALAGVQSARIVAAVDLSRKCYQTH